MPVLQCNQLRVLFNNVCALYDVELRLPKSGITAIIGPNGAGKTTLLNVITGFLRPDLGQCFLGEQETTHLSPFEIARLGITRTFQENRLITGIPVVENVLLARPVSSGETLPGALFGRFSAEQIQNKKRSLEILEFVGLDRVAMDFADTLSYGQQKLLSIACCLATDARIMLLDEPVTGVHPEVGEKILALLRELADRGKMVVFIEHDIGAVRQVADNLIVMDQGKIIADGVPSEVLDRPEIMEAYVG